VTHYTRGLCHRRVLAGKTPSNSEYDELEHDYGHEKQYLAAVVVMLILLAYLFHTVLQLCDEKHHRLRTASGTCKTFLLESGR
jgi:hypothetical protein